MSEEVVWEWHTHIGTHRHTLKPHKVSGNGAFRNALFPLLNPPSSYHEKHKKWNETLNFGALKIFYFMVYKLQQEQI